MSAGTSFAERYRMLGMIGKGAMGKVYLAEHTELGRRVAVKVLQAEWSSQPVAVRRFRVEARTMGALGHPNIVQVFDAGALPDGRLFLVMEHLDGHDLARELATARSLETGRACVLMRQVALALGAAHRLGIVHRDVKPSNVMLVRRPDGERAKVLDFGIAANTALSDGAERLTDPGSLLGTPAYMAPEQATDRPPTPAFDVYAAGVMLYQLLTGALPHRATTAFELLSLKLGRTAPPVDARRPGLPPLLVKLVADCLAIDPASRPADGDALVARLDEVLADMRTEALCSTEVARPSRAVRRRRAAPRWTNAALVAASVLGVAHVLTLLSQDPANAGPVEVVASTLDSRPLASACAEPPLPAQEPAPPVAAARERSPVSSSAPSAPVVLAEAPTRVATAPSRARPRSGADLTPRCQRVRTVAEEARRTQQWSLLRDHSRQQECWASVAEARKLQTKASMELGDFAGCVTAGERLKDPEVQQWLKLCRKRAHG